ncbi:membrane protein insertion efficiency factor YidD [Neisseria shayeganii]|uniref:Membrane protein insertion efficiency factor YidD n=1 Tax=Neisseria shayeganii TaxID=607712 RepID=A0A7D7NC58_9NEIS|nr:membrane protein insertion efficiency factor YidD [Neisseria shayeganii]QMT41095.1 membrane protein insertion efficiency factor YidD [Neisseria shayeganii]
MPMPKPFTAAALAAIRAYQRHLSPRKGYGCPHRLLHGGSGCSGVGYRLIRRYGLLHSWLPLRRRFARCRAARNELCRRTGPAYHQRGDCDCVPDADIDFHACRHTDCGGRFAKWLSCCECLQCCDACDWERKEKKRKQNQGFPADILID